MQYEWLKRQSAQKLIIIFSGWGFSAEVFDHLLQDDQDGKAEKYDVLFVSDYRELALQLPDISFYQQCYVLAWSFGVSAFATWFSALTQDQQQSYREKFNRCIAINGSMQPIDRHLGIPEVIMQKTIDTLSQQSFESFAARCFGRLTKPNDLHIDVAQKKQELEAILNRDHQAVVIWDMVWIAKRDKIFPPKNLSRAWQAYNDHCQEATIIQYCDAPHAPFQTWSSWDEIISVIV